MLITGTNCFPLEHGMPFWSSDSGFPLFQKHVLFNIWLLFLIHLFDFLCRSSLCWLSLISLHIYLSNYLCFFVLCHLRFWIFFKPLFHVTILFKNSISCVVFVFLYHFYFSGVCIIHLEIFYELCQFAFTAILFPL